MHARLITFNFRGLCFAVQDHDNKYPLRFCYVGAAEIPEKYRKRPIMSWRVKTAFSTFLKVCFTNFVSTIAFYIENNPNNID